MGEQSNHAAAAPAFAPDPTSFSCQPMRASPTAPAPHPSPVAAHALLVPSQPLAPIIALRMPPHPPTAPANRAPAGGVRPPWMETRTPLSVTLRIRLRPATYDRMWAKMDDLKVASRIGS